MTSGKFPSVCPSVHTPSKLSYNRPIIKIIFLFKRYDIRDLSFVLFVCTPEHSDGRTSIFFLAISFKLKIIKSTGCRWYSTCHITSSLRHFKEAPFGSNSFEIHKLHLFCLFLLGAFIFLISFKQWYYDAKIII